MTTRKQGEWPEVERREKERRDPGPPQHVEIEGISNGARALIQSAIDEARQTRRDLEGADEKRQAQWDRAVKLFVRGFAAVCGTIIVSAFGIGVWVNDTARDIEARPTHAVTRRMVEEAKIEILEEIADNTARDELRAEQITTGFSDMQPIVQQLQDGIEALRRDFEREHGRRP